MITPEDYLDELLAALTTTPLPHEMLPLAAARGRVLAQDVTAAVPVPPWTNSAMDGYAVRADDVAAARPQAPVSLPVTGDVPAGSAPPALAPGTAMRIMTGAMLPQGADAVVRVEDTDQAPGPHPLPARVAVGRAVPAGANVRRAGEDVQPGDLVLEAGTHLGARAVSALASVGCGQVSVRAAVRVGVVSTGAELTEPGEPLTPGRIPDSNSLLLAGLVEECGGQVVAVEHAGDSAESLAAALARAGEHADLVITSGGVSAGAFDPLTMLAAQQDGPAREAGEALGARADAVGQARRQPAQAGPARLRAELTFRKVAMQPGKPQGYGIVHLPAAQSPDSPTGQRGGVPLAQGEEARAVPLVMLPGNPVSVLVSFTLFVRPLIDRLSRSGAEVPAADVPGGTIPAGASTAPAHAHADAWAGTASATTARAATAWRCPTGRRQYVPVREVEPPADPAGEAGTAGASGPWVAPAHRLGSGSHLVASLPLATALAVVPAEVDAVEVGDTLTLIPLTSSQS